MADQEEARVDKSKVILVGIIYPFSYLHGHFFILTKTHSLCNILQRNIERKVVLSLKILKLKFVVADMLHWSFHQRLLHHQIWSLLMIQLNQNQKMIHPIATSKALLLMKCLSTLLGV